MIGWTGFFLEVLGVVVLSGGIVLGLRGIRSERRVQNALGLCIFVIAILFLGVDSSRKVRFYLELRSLETEQIAFIQVDQRRFTDASSIRAISTGLNSVTWFHVEHGGWYKEVPLVIQLNDGKESRFRVAQYGDKGAVIIGNNSSARLFSESLPLKLGALGYELPRTPRP